MGQRKPRGRYYGKWAMKSRCDTIAVTAYELLLLEFWGSLSLKQ